jgi:hypothetical protein
MKLGLKLISVRRPIGIFTWHQDDIAKRLGSHGENALADVNRKNLRMRLAKLWFRLRHLLQGGLIRRPRLDYELTRANGQWEKKSVLFARLGL